MKLSSEEAYRIQELEQRIKNGEMDAMMEYAQIYQNIFPEAVTDRIAKKMVKCYKTCIEAGNLTAALNLGAMYYGGEFIERDFKKAIKYYEMATDSDDHETQTRAWCNLGYCYYYGRDIPIDNEKAFHCYMHAALLGDANALYKIGDMYRYGRFVAKDEEMALFVYRRAWDALPANGYDSAFADICKRIGECALYGIGMERDVFLAFNMLSKAEAATYIKIKEKDPFAASLLPKIEEMLQEAKKQAKGELNI